MAHAGIVGYRDFFLDSDSEDNIVICLLMEHCADGDLWEPIAAAQRKKATMDMARCTVWLLQLIAALRYLHARDVLHRDIKPENIFLTQDGVVCKLGDFGLAKVSSGEHVAQQANTQCGTPDYMAPEVLEGSEYSRPADVFSLGGVVYALVCSHLPKMLAMKLGQGKALEWYSPRVEGPSGKLDGVEAPPLAATRRELRSLVGASMLLAAPAARITLDDLAARVAKLPAVATLNGDALAVATAAMAPPPATAAPAAPAAAAAAPAAAPPSVPPSEAQAAPAAPPSRPAGVVVTEVASTYCGSRGRWRRRRSACAATGSSRRRAAPTASVRWSTIRGARCPGAALRPVGTRGMSAR